LAAGVQIVTEGLTVLRVQLLEVVTVTAPDALFVVSATLVAVTVCEPAVAGAVYSPLLETAPTVLLPPAIPSTDHVTLVFVLPLTVAVNCLV
jgi:hypothetical protein